MLVVDSVSRRRPGSSHSAAFLFPISLSLPVAALPFSFCSSERPGSFFCPAARSLRSATIGCIDARHGLREMRLSSQDGFSRSTWRAGRGVAFSRCSRRPSVLHSRRSLRSRRGPLPPKFRGSCRRRHSASRSRRSSPLAVFFALAVSNLIGSRLAEA